MKIGLIGLGKMGSNVALNLKDHHIDVVGYDISKNQYEMLESYGIETSDTLENLLKKLESPRVLWLMLPNGEPTLTTIKELVGVLDEGDIVIDAGNSKYTDSISNHDLLAKHNIKFLDCGTSGGVSGARYGACLMVGGDKEAYEYLESVFSLISVDEGLIYTGRAGSGHFMKMVHNGIEYGMMQAIGEGFDLMKSSEFSYDLAAVAKNWNHGSVIRGWLMEIVQTQLENSHNLQNIIGEVDANGEAMWTVEAALEHNIATPVIALALMVRSMSKDSEKFGCKVVAAMRNGFGGHEVKLKGGKNE